MRTLEDLLLHPVRMRIIQHLSSLESATVGNLVELMNDVPRITIYRHINILHESGLLSVVKEVKIRGTYEREYALNTGKLQQTLAQNPVQESVYTFIIRLLSNFESYFKTEGADPVKDRLFLTENTLLLSDDEFEQFINSIYSVVKQYMNRPAAPERKARQISIVSSPYHFTEGSNAG